MIILACIFGLIAGSLALFPGTVTVVLSCVVGTGGAMWIIYGCMKRSLPIKLTWLLCAGLLADYCANMIINEGAAVLGGYSPTALIGVDVSWAAYALMLVMLACAVLLLSGYAEPPLIRDWQAIPLSSKGERFLWVGLVLIAISFVRGGTTLYGTVAEEGTGKVTILASLAGCLQGLVFPLAVAGAIQSSGMRRLRLSVIALASFMVAITGDRRALVFLLLVAFMAVPALVDRRWRIRWRLSLPKKIFLGLISVIGLGIAIFAFYGLRMATWEMGEGTHSIGSIVESAAATSFRSPGEIGTALANNFADRTAWALRYLSWLARGGNTPSPMLGQDIYQGARMAVPDAVYHLFGQSKDAVRHIGEEEDVANEHFGLPDEDMSNSILTGGIIDFGVPGVMLYPVCTCLLALGIVALSRHLLNREGQIVVAISLMLIFISSENTVGGYIAGLRDTLIVGFIWRSLYWLPSLSGTRPRWMANREKFAAE